MGDSALETDALPLLEVSYVLNCSFDDFIANSVSNSASKLETTFYASFDNPLLSKQVLESEGGMVFLPTLVLRGRYLAGHYCHDMPLSGLRFLDPDGEDDLAEVVAKTHAEAAIRMHAALETAGRAGIQQTSLNDMTILGRSVLFYNPQKHYANRELIEDAVKAYLDGLGQASGRAKNYLVLDALRMLR